MIRFVAFVFFVYSTYFSPPLCAQSESLKDAPVALEEFNADWHEAAIPSPYSRNPGWNGPKARRTEAQGRTEMSESERRSWLSAGVVTLGGETPFFSRYSEAATLAYHYQVNAHLFTLRALWTGNLCFVCDDMNESWDVALLYGRATRLEELHASLSVGAGVLGGDRTDRVVTGQVQMRNIATKVSAALQAQLFLTLNQSFGVGLYGFANLNSQRSFYGLTLNLQIGKLR